MSVTSQKYIIQNMEAIAFYDLTNGANLFIVDDLQSAEMTNEQEIVYANGKNGTRIGSAARNKAARITATNGAIVDGVLAAQVGESVSISTAQAMKTIPAYIDVITVTETQASPPVQEAVTEFKAIGTSGAEIKFVYKRNSDGTLGAKIAIGSTSADFTYDPATKKITLPSGFAAAGDQIVAIYDIECSAAKSITNYDNKFSLTGKMVADCFAKDICTGKSYFAKIFFPKAQASGAFTFSFGNDPSVQNLEFEALAGGCGSGSSHILWDFIIFDEADITGYVA